MSAAIDALLTTAKWIREDIDSREAVVASIEQRLVTERETLAARRKELDAIRASVADLRELYGE
jgi:hypothetical protein